MVRRNIEARLCPFPQRSNSLWNTDETQIQFAISYWRLAGITFGPKFQNHAIAELRRERQMSLQRDALSRARRKQAAQPRDRRIAAVGRDQRSLLNRLLARGNLPVIRAGIRRRKRGDGCAFENRRAQRPRAVED